MLMPSFRRSCAKRELQKLYGAPLSEEADEFLTACSTERSEKQYALHQQWLADYDRYDVDLHRGILRFSSADRASLVFDVEAVGSSEASANTCVWAWNDPKVNQAVAVPRELLVEIGHKYGLKYLLSGLIAAPTPLILREFSSFLSGIGLRIRDALGVYEAKHDRGSIFLLLRNPRYELREGVVVEFRRVRWGFYCALAYAAGLAFGGALLLYLSRERESILVAGIWWFYAALFVADAVRWRQPYARASQTDLALRPAPLRPRRVIPWSSIQSARRRTAGRVELTLPNGKRARIHLDRVDTEQRGAFVALLQEKLGPLPVV
jgi:Family of unknown function (DUF6882)